MEGTITCVIGRIGCGKSTWADARPGIRLSVDAWMQGLFPDGAGERHDVFTERVKDLLYAEARRLSLLGVPVVLDWGFWTRASRAAAAAELVGLPLEWVWLDPSESVRLERVAGRNRAVASGEAPAEAYFVDEGLAEKAESLFEPPVSGELPGLRILR